MGVMFRLTYRIAVSSVVAFGFVCIGLVWFAERADALSCEHDPASSFGDGSYSTGCDLVEGVYVAEEVEDVCRVVVTESDGTTRVLAWVGRAVLEIDHGWLDFPGMTGIESDGCGTWHRREHAIGPRPREFASGAYEVGRDIEPGVYESSAFSERCFWFYIRDWSYRDASATEVVVWLVGRPVVEIPDDAVGFYSARCGTWSPRPTGVPVAPASGFADGSYVAGVHIAPGRYVSEGAGTGVECVWHRTSPVASGAEGLGIGGHRSTGRQVAEISEADIGFYTDGCGEWSLFSEESDSVPRRSEFGDGTYIVDADIAAETYVADAVVGRHCEWEVLSGFGGTGSDVSRSGVGVLRGIVKIEADDAGFRSSGCGLWRALDSVRTEEPLHMFPDGEYAVGVHIAPGLYVSDGASVGRCFWRRFSGFTWDDSEVLGLRNQVGRVVVRIPESDAGFESLGCGTWRRVTDLAIGGVPSTWFGSGSWMVGSEVRPGLYSARLGVDDICFWGRYSDFTGSAEDLLAAGVAQHNALVLVDADDVGVYSDGCGTWVLASALPERVAVDSFGDGVYLVGSEVLPGTYVSDSRLDEPCVWSRLSGFRGTEIERIATISSDSLGIVTILDSDAGFRSWGCDHWRVLEPLHIGDGVVTSSFGDGMHLVGRDIAPGVYRAAEHLSTRCRWVRLSDWSWTVGVIAERVQRERAVAEIAVTDAGFLSEGCGEWVPVDGSTAEDGAVPATGFGDGSHRVGMDIGAGLYRSDQQFEVGDCRWARLSGFGGTQSGIIASGGSADGDWYVEVKEDDAGFESSGCGAWSLVDDTDAEAELSLASEFGDGAYRVGQDIAAGVYVSDIGTARYRDGEFVPACRWSRVSGFGHDAEEEIEARAGWGEQRAEIMAGDAGFVSTGCGVWRRVGPGG